MFSGSLDCARHRLKCHRRWMEVGMWIVAAGMFHARAWADSPATAPDKSQYTLFNPTPANQLRDMETDRPNTANSPRTIDAGHVQIETGIVSYSYYQSSFAPFAAWTFGETNFRLGVLNNLELNVVLDPYDLNISEFHPAGDTYRQASFGDTVVGGKINLWGNDAPDRLWNTVLALQPQFKLPTADTNVGNGHVDYLLLIPFTITLQDKFTFSEQPAFAVERSTFNTGYATAFQNAVCLDRVFFERLDLYVEYVVFAPAEANTEVAHSVDFGGIYQLTPSITVDTAIALGLNHAANTVGATVGISFRF